MTDKNVNYSMTIGLRFPYSVCETDNTKVFLMSYNCAIKSDYLKVILEDEEEKPYSEIEIPKSFYKGLRFIDINQFIKMWTGKEPNIYSINNNYFCWKLIAKLCQALLLTSDLEFANKLEDKYPPYIKESKWKFKIVPAIGNELYVNNDTYVANQDLSGNEVTYP